MKDWQVVKLQVEVLNPLEGSSPQGEEPSPQGEEGDHLEEGSTALL